MNYLFSKIAHPKNLVIALVALGLIFSGAIFLTGGNLRSSVANIDSSTFQAIHLDNNETYFGKITSTSSTEITLVDVFYFLDDSQKTLVKKGDASLTLNRAHVLTTENLKKDGAILHAITNYFKNKN